MSGPTPAEIITALQERMHELSDRARDKKLKKSERESILTELRLARMNLGMMLSLVSHKMEEDVHRLLSTASELETKFEQIASRVITDKRKTHSYPPLVRNPQTKAHIVLRQPEYPTNIHDPVERSSCCDSPIGKSKDGDVAWCIQCNQEINLAVRPTRRKTS